MRFHCLESKLLRPQGVQGQGRWCVDKGEKRVKRLGASGERVKSFETGQESLH